MLPLARSSWPTISQTISSAAIPMTPPNQAGNLRARTRVRGAAGPGIAGTVAFGLPYTSALGRRAHAEQDLAELVAQLVEVRVAQHLGGARPRQVDRHLGHDAAGTR